MKIKRKIKITLALSGVSVMCMCGLSTYKIYEDNNEDAKYLLSQSIEALATGDLSNTERPCNVDLKKGNGVWRCGNPCVYESKRVRRNSLPENEGVCYFY